VKIAIRHAENKDANFIAWIMLTAARSGKATGFWDLYLPGNDEEKINFISKMALSEIKTLCHYSHFLIAEADTNVAGGLACCFPNGLTGEPFRTAANKIWKEQDYSEELLVKSRERVAAHFTCMPNYPDDVWVLEWVALLPEYRKLGIMQQLLAKAINIGKEKGAKRFQIAVAKGNTHAQKAYAMAGFTKQEEKTNPDFFNIFGYEGIERLVIEK